MKQALAGLFLILPLAAWGSSDEAWDDFRASVEESCRSLVQTASDATVTVEVNPFGSESYGAALITVGQGGTQERMICIYDKQAATAEVTAPFADAAPVE